MTEVVRPQICGAEIHVAARVTRLVAAADGPLGPMPDGGWCGLQEHPEDYPHHGLVESLYGGEAVWMVWHTGDPPTLVVLQDCCTVVRGACSGYVHHPGVCTPWLHNPRREAALREAGLPPPLRPGRRPGKGPLGPPAAHPTPPYRSPVPVRRKARAAAAGHRGGPGTSGGSSSARGMSSSWAMSASSPRCGSDSPDSNF